MVVYTCWRDPDWFDQIIMSSVFERTDAGEQTQYSAGTLTLTLQCKKHYMIMTFKNDIYLYINSDEIKSSFALCIAAFNYHRSSVQSIFGTVLMLQYNITILTSRHNR